MHVKAAEGLGIESSPPSRLSSEKRDGCLLRNIKQGVHHAKSRQKYYMNHMWLHNVLQLPFFPGAARSHAASLTHVRFHVASSLSPAFRFRDDYFSHNVQWFGIIVGDCWRFTWKSERWCCSKSSCLQRKKSFVFILRPFVWLISVILRREMKAAEKATESTFNTNFKDNLLCYISSVCDVHNELLQWSVIYSPHLPETFNSPSVISYISQNASKLSIHPAHMSSPLQQLPPPPAWG